jgi:L,D-peptidoglycan transpeptidase YkuD (ErfK/YbiS/YcfS/YnhG family)
MVRHSGSMRYGFVVFYLLGMINLSAFELPEKSTQCVVGISEGWDSSHVTLTYHEKTGGKWKQVGESWKGRLGSKGLVWGRGLHSNPSGAVLKKEADGRSPAGVFNLGGVWGVHEKVKKHPKTFYHRVTTRDLWVEDPHSKFYNQFLSLDREPKTEWEKEARMVQDDHAHSLKMFIGHNAYPNTVADGGSSIFFHIWRREGAAASAGCTTMPENKLRELIATVDPGRRPLYVLLPRKEYEKFKSTWKLP